MSHFVEVLASIPDSYFKAIVRDYYTKCNFAHDAEFSIWRKEIKKLEEEGWTDVYDGWHYPYLRSRLVHSFEQINFESNLSPKLLRH